ncbi:MAG TPA: hypothetical protein VJL33_06975 [Candidatus Bathyarchaeia archaeon]|nr:hypothetical protein [Candidatus Bathyarchaeia archaeon]
MANVSFSDVRDAINVSKTDVPDAKLQKMVKHAEVTLELEMGKEIDYEDCTEAEKESIALLAAVYAVCYLTVGSAVGLSFSVGDQNVSVLDKAPPLSVLQQELERILGKAPTDSLSNMQATIRKRLAQSFCHRLAQIHFHKLRHWKITMYAIAVPDQFRVQLFSRHKDLSVCVGTCILRRYFPRVAIATIGL